MRASQGSETNCHRSFGKERARDDDAWLPRAAGEFLLGRCGGAGQDAEDFFFFHDDEVFAVDLDLGAGVLAEQDAVAFL
jgi:hypothetical protein